MIILFIRIMNFLYSYFPLVVYSSLGHVWLLQQIKHHSPTDVGLYTKTRTEYNNPFLIFCIAVPLFFFIVSLNSYFVFHLISLSNNDTMGTTKDLLSNDKIVIEIVLWSDVSPSFE